MPNNRKQKQVDQSSSPQEDLQKQPTKPTKFSQFRDYISMKAAMHIRSLKHKSKQSNKQNRLVEEQLDDEDQIDMGNNNRYAVSPISLLSNYNSQNYQQYIQFMKENVKNQMPYTQVSEQLLYALALNNNNICLYGFGSKIQYLKYLVDMYLADHYVWEVHGYRLGIKEKKIFDHFGKFLIHCKLVSKLQRITMEGQLLQYREVLTKYANKSEQELVVAFHCIDSLNLINSQSQKRLSELFSLPRIKLICSVDSIKIASAWSPDIKTNYKFQFFHIRTSKPNIKQQLYRPNATDSREQEDQALQHILQSLNNNQRRILKLFAKKQLDNLQREQAEYYTLDTLLEDCIENVILSSDTQLRENLYELLDHKVIVCENKVENDKRVGKEYKLQCNRAMLDKIYKDKVED